MAKKNIQLGPTQRTISGYPEGVRPPLKFLAPSPAPLIISLAPFIAKYYVNYINGLTEWQISNPQVFLDAFHKFYAGKQRLIFAFRHQSHADGPLLYYTLTHDIYKLAQKTDQPLKKQPHVHFMYDRGITLWAGIGLERLLPLMSATPILRGKADRQGIDSARKLIVSGQHPLAIAPEGGTNNLSYVLGPLQPGLVQLASWAYDDLKTQGKQVPVTILPVGVMYKYEPGSWRKIDKLMSEMETAFGVDTQAAISPAVLRNFNPEQVSDAGLRARYVRYLRIHAVMLDCLEEYYREYFKVDFHFTPETDPDERVTQISDCAFSIAEAGLKTSPRGSRTTDRIYQLEQAAWSRMFKNASAVPVRKALEDWAARDAESAERQMRLASNLHRISLAYLFHNPSYERLADVVTLTWQAMSRILHLKGLLAIGPKKAFITAGTPVVVDPDSASVSKKVVLARSSEALHDELMSLTEQFD